MRMAASLRASLDREQVTVHSRAVLLAALSPNDVLRRGYATLQQSESGLGIFSAAQVQPGMTVTAIVHDGSIETSVLVRYQPVSSS